jgi:hypothetical protein
LKLAAGIRLKLVRYAKLVKDAGVRLERSAREYPMDDNPRPKKKQSMSRKDWLT